MRVPGLHGGEGRLLNVGGRREVGFPQGEVVDGNPFAFQSLGFRGSGNRGGGLESLNGG